MTGVQTCALPILEQARTGRLHILERMTSALTTHRTNLSPFAPRIYTLKVKQDKIRDIIGQGGKTIRAIQADCGVKINIEDTGIVTIASADEASLQKAKDMISRLTEEVEVGKIYMGTVRKIMDFGAFVEVLPGDRKSTRLNSSHSQQSRMPSSA